MVKKIIGLSCGRKNGMCEIFLKEAAMGAEEYGVETEIIRAMSLNVLPCTGCGGCIKTNKCTLKDDVHWILEKTCVEDAALITAVPCYHIRANGYFICIHERMNHIFSGNMNILKKTRVGAMIGVGGSGYDGWASLTNPMVNIFMMHTRVLVDQMQVNFCGMKEWNLWMREDMTPVTQKARVQDMDYEQIWRTWPQEYDPAVFFEKALARARELGRNVARAMGMPIEKAKFVGEKSNVSCPVCHSNILLVPEDMPHVACPICWVRGEVKSKNGKITIKWNEKDAGTPRFSHEAVSHHVEWLGRHHNFDPRNFEKMEEMTKKHKEYGKIIKPEK
jgi:multimeric flavodoxin WrbA